MGQEVTVLNAGWCAVDITPPVGTPLAGFAARKGVSEGIHDPLMARALVIEREGGETVVLLTLDVVGVPTPMARQVRERIAAAIGTAPDHVMVSASHTHSGPVLEASLDTIGLASEHYRATLADDLVGAAVAAAKRRGPVRLEAGAGRIEGIGRNRRNDDGLPVDPEVGLLSFLPSAGPGCRFVTYACHAVTLGPDNLQITADYPGYAMRFIERVMGPGTVAMFANGAAGDVNTGHSADLSALGYFIPNRTFEQAERLGTMLGAEVVRIAQGSEEENDPLVRAASREVLLPGRMLPPIAEAQADLERKRKALDELRAKLGGAVPETDPRLVKARVEELYARLLVLRVTQQAEKESSREAPAHVAVEIQGIRIGGTVLIGVPVELFVEIGLAVKAASPWKRTWVLGYTNGSMGYLPSREAHAEGGYEVASSIFAAESVSKLERAMLEVASSLK